MSLLVLSPDGSEASAWRSRLLAAQPAGDPPEPWDAVLVIDDHGPEALELLARAQAFCAQPKGPALAVLVLQRAEGAGLEVREPGAEPYLAGRVPELVQLAGQPDRVRVDPDLGLLCVDFDA